MLKFKRLHPLARITAPVYSGDAGYDVCAVEDVLIEPESIATVRTGLAIEVPEDYYVLVRTRSGYGVKRDMQLHHGLIDAGYRNEITIKIYNHGKHFEQVKVGDKICQFVVMPRIVLPLEEVEELSKSDRGMNGLGSTGK